MTVLVKDINGEIQKFYHAKVYLNKNAGILEVAYINYKSGDTVSPKRRRNYILSNLISYEAYQVDEVEDEDEDEDEMDKDTTADAAEGATAE